MRPPPVGGTGMANAAISNVLKEIEDGNDRIDLSNCELNDDDVGHLCEALLDNSTVTYLGLSGNGIGDEATRVIADMLKSNSAISTLDLNVNNIGDDGALYLSQALRVNDTLAELFLYGNQISVVGDNHLLYGLQENSTVSFIDLQYEVGLSDSAVQDNIQQRVKQNLHRCFPEDSIDLMQEQLALLERDMKDREAGASGDVQGPQEGDASAGQGPTEAVAHTTDAVCAWCGVVWCACRGTAWGSGEVLFWCECKVVGCV